MIGLSKYWSPSGIFYIPGLSLFSMYRKIILFFTRQDVEWKHVNICSHFNYTFCFCWLFHAISLCTRTIYYIFHMDSTLKQTKYIVLFFSRPQRLICCFFEYKCLWGPIKSVRCNTECNISAVAIAWLARLRLGQNACKDKLHQAVWVWQRERIGADLLNFQWEKREKKWN